MKRLSVYRTNISPYQGKQFISLEKDALESVGALYQVEPNSPSVLVTNTHTVFDELDVDWNKIELIIHPNSGYDNFSIDFVQNANFPIIIGNPVRANGVATYSLSAFFDYFSKIPKQTKWSKERTWNRTLPSNVTVQLIGLGHIGKLIFNSLESVVKKINVYDPPKGHLDLLPEEADVVIMAASLNPTSKAMIDKAFLSKLKPTALIINGARGKLIDQSALFEFLKANSESYAYLDVFEEEPFNDSEIENIKNLHPSSHIAGVSKDLNQRLLDFEKEIVREFTNNRAEFRTNYSDLLLQNRVRGDYLI